MNICPTLKIDPFDEAFLARPHARHGTLRDAGPVFWLEPIACYGMARFADVQTALKDWQTYLSGRGVGLADFASEEPWRPPSLLLESDPPIHDRTRGLMDRIVRLAALRQLLPEWRAKADILVADLAARGRIDAVPDLAEAFPLQVFPDLIGLREEGRENLLPYGAIAFNAFGPRNQIAEQALASAGKAIEWVAESCRCENLRPGGWGMQVYEAADRERFAPGEAERLVRSFLTAGIDTTINGIAALVNAFARNPDQWARLRADPSLTRRAIEESLRWHGTVQTFFRTTSRDVEVAGYAIPEGSKVLLFLAAANRDPRQWNDPDRFDIGRNAGGHVGFGFGIHQCLGQMVARIEAEAVLGAMIARIAEIRPVGNSVVRLNNTLHALASVPVHLIPA